MSQLRQETKQRKQYKDELITDAAYKWLSENVILLNEKIDRRTVNRLIDSIQKFEETFGPFKEKVPTLKHHLDEAETGLQLVITGKLSDRKTSNMLKHLTFLYSLLSNFFSRDLPVLLRAKIFDVPKEYPDRKLIQVAPMSGGKFKADVARDALANGLKPSKEERQLISKIYRSNALPKLKEKEVADELMNLTYQDLEELSKVGKVPMVATEEEMEQGVGGDEGLQVEESKNPKKA